MASVPAQSSSPAASDKGRRLRSRESHGESGSLPSSKKRAASVVCFAQSDEPWAAGADKVEPDLVSQSSAGDQSAERADTDRHVPDTTTICATPHRQARPRPLAILHLSSRVLTRSPQWAAGTINLPHSMPAALRAMAQRIRQFPAGDFEPSPPPHLVEKLTDGFLVVASDAVAKVAAEASPRIAGRARYRLLAWTVADARGAQERLSKAVVETAGKRLEAQAQRVRAAISQVKVVHEEERADARKVWGQDDDIGPADDAKLAADLERIDGEEKDTLEMLVSEVYIGFYELEPEPEAEALVDEARQEIEAVDADPVVKRVTFERDPVSVLGEHAGAPDAAQLMQRALNHVIELEAKLEAERGANAELRASVISERDRADKAELRASEAEYRVSELLWRQRQQDERLADATSDLEFDLAAARIDIDVLRRRIRELEDGMQY